MRVRGHDELGALAAPELLALERSALGGDHDGVSPLDVLEGQEPLFEMDRAGVGTPLGDLETLRVVPA